MASAARVGERRSYDGALCTVRYVGEVAGTTGSWLGVEWDDPSRGKHDGQHKGVRYFSCKNKSPTAASFVRPTRPTDAPQTFLDALHLKYATDPTADQNPPRQIVFSGKVAEEVGFEKIRRKQAQLDELQFVILDGTQVASAYASPDDAKDGRRTIGQVCPKVRELDLSRNLFEQFGPIVDVCSELRLLRNLRANGNRFRDVLQDEKLASAQAAFNAVVELAIEDALLSWDEICHIAAKFPSLTTLHAGANQLTALTPIPASPFTHTLVSLHFEINEFTSLADLAPLSAIPTLRNLLLKGNRISHITPPSSSSSSPPPIFSPALHYLDLSYNHVASWSFVDALPRVFPGLTSLRFTHNPIYDDPDLDSIDATTTTTDNISTNTPVQNLTDGDNSLTTPKTNTTTKKTDESYMLTLARLPGLKSLNFSPVRPADRADAEMFYLSRVARQLAAKDEDKEAEVLARHPRWEELCEEYGRPAVVRRRGVGGGMGVGGEGAGLLENRLVSVEFVFVGGGVGEVDGVKETERGGIEDGGVREGEKEEKEKEVTVEVPRSFDIYAVKGLVGKLFGLPPLRLRLVWETGEWDPVGGFDDAEEDSEQEEEDLEAEWERTGESGELPSAADGNALASKRGRWVKREVELKDGPRQFGYCVDGMEARIRVERR